MKYRFIIILCLIIPNISFSQELSITEKREFPPIKDFVVNASFSPYRNFFALTRLNNVIEIFDRNWDQIFEHQGNSASYAGVLAFSPDERYLAYGKYKGNSDIAIISLDDMKVTQTLRGHSYFISDLCFSNDGNYLASVSHDKTMVLWKLDGEKFIKHQLFDNYEDRLKNVRFSFDDTYLLTSDDDGYISIYEKDKDGYKLFQKIKSHYSYIYGFDYHPGKNEFLAGSSSGLIKYEFDKNRFTAVDSIKKGIDIRNGIYYSPGGEYAAIPYSNQVKIFNTEGKKLNETDGIYRHSEAVLGCTFSDDGQFLSTFSVDSSLIIWEISPLEPSKKTLISSWVNNKLSLAQRRIMTYDVVSNLYNRVDKSMLSPRDEFETSEEYNNRRLLLEDWTLSLIQNQVESLYNIREGDENMVQIPLQNIIGYNADLRIYKIRFMETEAGVEIPVNDAKQFKQKWERSYILANKSRENGIRSYQYSDFRLVVPGISKTFRINPLENPFHYNTKLRQSTSSAVKENPLPAISESNNNTDGSNTITHALLFATNIYDSFSELANPVLDANTIAAELKENYGVQTEVVLNPTLTQTAEKIREYASQQYHEDENLIIFFAGHGEYDQVFREGYVISSDSRANDKSKTSYLSHSNLRTMINNINCKHILLVMDVCFGGTFDPNLAKSSHRGSMEMYSDIPKEEFISRKLKYKARLYLTSGGKEYVPDGRHGFHSPFARRFIEALRKYGGEDGILTTAEILQYVEKVNPQPRFGEFGDNEPGSDFILIAK